VPVGGNPSSIAVNPVTNKIYVETAGDNVAVIDGATNSFATFNAGSVGSIAVNPVTDKVYISNGPFSGIVSPLQVSEVDGVTNNVTIIAPGSAGPLAVDPVTNKVYCSSSDGVTVIDGATNEATTISAASSGAIAVNPVTNKVYVSYGFFFLDEGFPSVTAVDGTTNEAAVMAPGIAGSIAVNPVTDTIYVADYSGSNLFSYDGVTNVSTLFAQGITGPLAVNTVTNTIYAASVYVGPSNSGAVAVIDGVTGTSTIVPVGPLPQEIVVNPVTNKVYVLGSSDVTVIDGATNTASTVAVGTAPQGIALNPVTGNVYVGNNGSGNVTVIGGVPLPPAPPAARLTNLSVRAQVGTGGNILIPGFVVAGSGTETLLIRADGPSLAQFGVPGLLAQPSLSVFDGTGAMVASNTGWGTNSNPTQIAAVTAQVGAFPFASGSADCALLVTLAPGTYTAHVSGVNNTTGVALAEVYEVSSSGTRLVNLSTRAQVGSGANIIIPGFEVSGGSEDLLVRADGPALAHYGVSGFLDRPSLSVFDSSGALKGANSGWASADIGLIAGFDAAVGAFPLQPGSADSAQVVRLAPGGYTMPVSSLDGSTGVALAEVYEAP
jgi:DNA-binding beta-propeller fold protein YncE